MAMSIKRCFLFSEIFLIIIIIYLSSKNKLAQTSNENTKRISIDLPESLVIEFDKLRGEWGYRARGPVIERLLREVLYPANIEEEVEINNNNIQKSLFNSNNCELNEDKSLVLIKSENNNDISLKNKAKQYLKEDINKEKIQKNSQINLPSFVKQNVNNLKKSLNINHNKTNEDIGPINTIREEIVSRGIEEVNKHWYSLYGDQPNDQVIEASMDWFDKYIWRNLDYSENLPFTWTAANRLMKDICPFWKRSTNPTFDNVIVIAGVLEDPFAADTLISRIPTLIRRFVSSFKRSKKTTSFEALESTMTVHRALKLLDLSTQPGQSLTLKTIRAQYKKKALENHPDSGGSTEEMRRLNEGCQLLKNLYKN